MHMLMFTCSVELCCYALEAKCFPVKSNALKLWSSAGDAATGKLSDHEGSGSVNGLITDRFTMVVRKTFRSRAWLKKVGHSLPPGHQRWASLMHPNVVMVFCLVSDRQKQSIQETLDWKPWDHESKYTYPPFKLFPLGIRPSGENLMHSRQGFPLQSAAQTFSSLQIEPHRKDREPWCRFFLNSNDGISPSPKVKSTSTCWTLESVDSILGLLYQLRMGSGCQWEPTAILEQWHSTADSSRGRHSGVDLEPVLGVQARSTPCKMLIIRQKNHSTNVNPREGPQFRKCHSKQERSRGFNTQ